METNSSWISANSDKPIKVTKWKVKNGSKVGKGALLCLYETNDAKNLKLKSTSVGTVLELIQSEDFLPPGTGLVKMQSCTHPTVMKDMCADCGADLREDAGIPGRRKESVSASVAMVHNIPELIISEEQAMELGKADEDRLLRTRKLVLLVDLDQTLIHTTNDIIPKNLKDIYHFQLGYGSSMPWYHTRIRPMTQQFLKNISKMYELHICTFGSRLYAHIIAKYLDPEGKYFSHRILSRDECFNQNSKMANLKALFPCGDSMVCIIDDREDVWNYSPNLIHVKPYRFFQGTADINAPPGLNKTEHDNQPLTHKVRTISRSNSRESNSEEKNVSETTKKPSDKSSSDANNENSYTDSSLKINKSDQTDSASELHEVIGNGGKEGEEISKEINSVSKNSEFQPTIQEKDEEGKDKQSIKGDKHDNCEENNKDEMEVVQGETKNGASAEQNKMKEVEKEARPKQEVEKEDNPKEEVEKVANPKEEVEKKENPKEEEEKKDSPKERDEEDIEIEWEDEDDYLIYLEDILTRVHKAFYDLHDQLKSKGESKDKLDMKNILLYVKRKCLKGVNVIFSGVFPTSVPLEKSRAYHAAKALGANVQSTFVSRAKDGSNKSEYTTHVVAARLGTVKVRMAQKHRHVKLVNPQWLWSCMERLEHVDERLFPLNETTSGGAFCESPDLSRQNRKRKNEDEMEPDKRAKKSGESSDLNEKTNESEGVMDEFSCKSASAAPVTSTRFSTTFNPLLAFSDDDLACMDKEVEDLMDEEEDESDENDIDRNERIRLAVLSSGDDDNSSSDSMSGDFPRGWNIKRRKSKSNDSSSDNEKSPQKGGNDEESENELDKYEKTVAAFAPDTDTDTQESFAESVGSVDDEMAEAVEREFLSQF